MLTITRKQVEDYYEKEWIEIVSPKTLSLLIELTCRTFGLNQPLSHNYLKQKELRKLQELGQI